VGAALREGNAHLRTRVGADGMDYKGYNIAVHEMGHTVEQVFSLAEVDHTLLQGVPNTAFSEAFAFLFQSRDLQLLGRPAPDADEAAAWRALQRFWDAFEISGVALLDIDIWHWMYDHPEATPAELREAMVELARGIWNEYYAPVFGVSDSVLPAIYSHVIAYGLYTPDYPLGMIITAQVEAYMCGKNLAEEMERMCRQGRIAPDIWMEGAVGSPVTADALFQAADAALTLAGAAP
jgi:oligoendopeptidase F